MEKGGCGRYGDGSFMVHGSSDEDFFLEGSDEPDRQLAHMRMGKSETVTWLCDKWTELRRLLHKIHYDMERAG